MSWQYGALTTEATTSIPNERAQFLLKALIQRFIRDGQPVGSRTLSRDSGLELSPATIRNVMSDLEELGLVSAPHTSAGRIPTSQGYRLFVDTLVRYKQPNEGDIRKLQMQLSEQQDDPGALLGSVSTQLSSLTSLASCGEQRHRVRDARIRIDANNGDGLKCFAHTGF